MSKSRNVRWGIFGVVAAVVLVLFGCATRNVLFEEADEAAEQSKYAVAAQTLEENRTDIYTDRDKVLYYLDVGMLEHHAGEYADSTEKLQEAEYLIEDYFTTRISQAAKMVLINDTMMNYAGEDFEDIYLNVFKALNYTKQQEYESAMVEVRRIGNKLDLLEDKYSDMTAGYLDSEEAEEMELEVDVEEDQLYNSALARYLGIVLRRASGDMDGARIDWEGLQEAFQRQPSIYDFDIPLDESTAQEPTEARASILAFTGKSPIKLAQRFRIMTGHNRISISYVEEDADLGRLPDSYMSFYYPGVESGYRFIFELPRMKLRGSEVTDIRVYADGELLGELEMLENMAAIAQQAFQIKEPVIFLRTVLRSVVRGILGKHAGDAMTEAGSKSGSAFGLILGIIGSVATDVSVEAAERADLRISRYFPAYAYVGEWELPEGEYDFRIEYYDGEQKLYTERLDDQAIQEGAPNLFSSKYLR